MGGGLPQRDGKLATAMAEDNYQNLQLSNNCMENCFSHSLPLQLLIYYLNCTIFLWFSVDNYICPISLILPLIIKTRITRLQVLYLSPPLPQQLWFCNQLHSYSQHRFLFLCSVPNTYHPPSPHTQIRNR